MRWPWQRRASAGESAREIKSSGRVRRQARKDKPANLVLAFAQAYLAASGARVRLNDDLVAATLPDGTTQMYTTTRVDANLQATVLTPGGEALAAMLGDVTARSRIGALTLPRFQDPESLVRASLVAAPKTCERCVAGSDDDGCALCDQCPLRTGGNRFVVAALPKRSSLKTQPEATATSVELTYRVSARDRAGRTDEVVRLAFDADGRRVEALSLAQARLAGVGIMPVNAATLGSAALAQAEDALRPALDVAALMWRTRSAEVYRKRLDDLTGTFDRLRREQPGDEQAILQSLQRELAALADTFAVEAQAALESVYFVDAPVAEVAWHAPDGREIVFRVDAGRGLVAALCASCGTLTARGGICEQGHVTCATCGLGCVACHGVHRAAEANSPTKPPRTKTEASALTLDQLDTMEQLTPYLWHTAAAWLLSRESYAVRDADPHATVWHAERYGQQVLVMRLPAVPGFAVTSEDVRRVAQLARGSGAQGLLLTLSPSSREAAALAKELGVVLWDRAKLGECLAIVASEQTGAAGPTRGEARERIAAANKTRTTLLHAMSQAAAALDVVPSGQRVVGSAALSAALSDLAQLCQSAEQAFVAWETLVADWLAIFPERVTPTGGLVIDTDKEALRELRERAIHLGEALASVLEQLGRAPRRGELGYDAWCAALIEEYTARCRSLRARVAVVDPAEWEDARRARSNETEVAAARAEQEWRHAAARAAKAYAQVAQLAIHR